jgi:hypothetical protein
LSRLIPNTRQRTSTQFDFMLTTGPWAIFLSLYEAFDRRLKADRELLLAVLSFDGTKSAVILPMRAIDVLARWFREFVNQPNSYEQRSLRPINSDFAGQLLLLMACGEVEIVC